MVIVMNVMHVKDVTNVICVMLLTVTLDGGLQPLPELEADGGNHEAGVSHELSVPHLTQGMGIRLCYGYIHCLMKL